MEPLDLDLPEQIELLLAGYALGNLTSEEVIRLKSLLEENPELAREVEELQATLSLLPLSLPVTERPPLDLEEKILQSAQADLAPLPVVTPNPRLPRPRSKAWRMGLVGTVTFIISFLGIRTWQLEQELAALQVTNQQLLRSQQVLNLLRDANKRFMTMKATSPGSATAGSLMIVPRRASALLILQYVEPLAEGKVYRMWAIVQGKKLFCKDFKPNSQGEVMLEVPLKQWGAVTEVVVTLEPEKSLPQPVGEMVITGN